MDARPKRVVSAIVALLAVTALTAIGAATAGAETVYNNVPSPLPGNFASIGLEATSSTEFGGEIELAGKARSKPTVTVVMSSWACETGAVSEGCKTSAKSKGFKVPVTIKVYNVGELEEGPIAEHTKMERMAYRPSSDPEKCDTETWYDAADGGHCYHGYAFAFSMKLGMLKKMPRRSVITVSYPHSSGPAQSLNVATSEPEEKTLSLGAQPAEEWFVNSTWSGMYCTGTRRHPWGRGRHLLHRGRRHQLPAGVRRQRQLGDGEFRGGARKAPPRCAGAGPSAVMFRWTGNDVTCRSAHGRRPRRRRASLCDACADGLPLGRLGRERGGGRRPIAPRAPVGSTGSRRPAGSS